MSQFGRSSREQAEFEKYHYPGSTTLRNKLGLTNRSSLETAERYLAAKRARLGFPQRALVLDLKGLREIHRHLFQDVYGWAGEFRTYTTGRGAAPFATPENIEPWLQRQFADLRNEGYLISLEAHEFALRAAHFVNEINAAHPFIEGNGRVQRAWLRNLAESAGHQVLLHSGDRERWYEASQVGFEEANSEPLARLIFECMERG